MASGHKESLSRALDSADAEERRQATAELGRLPIDEAIPLLLRSLADEDWRVRKEATNAAQTFSGARALIAALIRVFQTSEDVGLRNAAVEVLADAGHASTAALVDALPRLDADGRKLAVEALGRGRDPAALGALTLALSDHDDNVRQGSVEAIASIGPLARERVSDILLGCLDDRDPLVRLTALNGLTALEVAVPWPRLQPLLDDTTLRRAALGAAALSEAPEAAHALVRMLAQARGGSFEQALRGLGRVQSGPAAASVTEALRAEGPDLGRRLVSVALSEGGEDPVSRRAVALGLAAAAGAPGTAAAALAALSEDLLSEPAQRALCVLGLPALPQVIARLGDHSLAPEARAVLIDVIVEVSGEAAPPEALAALRAAAHDPERPIATRALSALARRGEEQDLELAASLTLSDVRSVALTAEGTVAALAARFPTAARALADARARDEAYLLPASIALGALGAALAFQERDATFLAHAATAGDTRARVAAVAAVAALHASLGARYPGAMEVFRFALTDEEREVQLAAARGLGRLLASPDAPRASEILDLVDRSGAAELLAVTVRAIGEGISPAPLPRQSYPLGPPADDLVASLATFARSAPSAVAIAAVDSLGCALRAGSPAAARALAGALDHTDDDVVKAALLKLASQDGAASGLSALARALDHPSQAVRSLAAEILGDRDADEARALLVRRLHGEGDRRVHEAIQRALGQGTIAPTSFTRPLDHEGAAFDLKPRAGKAGFDRGEGGG